jgi:hypothetical protein
MTCARDRASNAGPTATLPAGLPAGLGCGVNATEYKGALTAGKPVPGPAKTYLSR